MEELKKQDDGKHKEEYTTLSQSVHGLKTLVTFDYLKKYEGTFAGAESKAQLAQMVAEGNQAKKDANNFIRNLKIAAQDVIKHAGKAKTSQASAAEEKAQASARLASAVAAQHALAIAPPVGPQPGELDSPTRRVEIPPILLHRFGNAASLPCFEVESIGEIAKVEPEKEITMAFPYAFKCPEAYHSIIKHIEYTSKFPTFSSDFMASDAYTNGKGMLHLDGCSTIALAPSSVHSGAAINTCDARRGRNSQQLAQ